MKMRNFDLPSSRVLGSGMILGLLAVMVVAGCQPGLQPGETSHKLSVAWPIFDVEKSEGISADGVHWKKEKGDAAFCLSSWERVQKFDKEDNLVYRKERKTFIPLYNAEMEESQQGTKTWGSVLLYPYTSYDKNTAGAILPAATPKK